jgi:DNA-binding NarL/FixJ family response regulator
MATAAQKSNRPEAPSSRETPLQQVKVIVADTQSIYRVGVRKIFALEDDLRVVAQAENLAQTIAAVTKANADVLLFESAVSPTPGEALGDILRRAPSLKTIVVMTEPSEEITVEVLRRGARGILPRSVSPDLLVKCVRKVADGEMWLDNRGVNWVIEAYRNQAALLTSPKPKRVLSDKEKMIISGVTQGLRNKEIAAQVGTTEQVIKNYLRKIFDKLGVSDRLELALFCIHHRLLQDPQAEIPIAADAPDAADVSAPAEMKR